MVLQSDVVASNGMIHIINKLMDSVSPTVESDQQVEPHSLDLFTLAAGFSALTVVSVLLQENVMKIISDYGKFDQFRALLQVSSLFFIPDTSCCSAEDQPSLLCVQKADLASVLDLPGPITVFAPDSSAFSRMSADHLQFLSSAQVRSSALLLSCFPSPQSSQPL